MTDPTTVPGGFDFTGVARRTWIWTIVRGMLAIILGIIAFVAPLTTALALAILVGAYAIVDGIFDIVEGIRHRGSSSMVPKIVFGVISLIFGILILAWPGLSLAVLVVLVAIWAVIIGILQIISSVGTRSHANSGWVWGVVGGALSILFGILVFFVPSAGLVTLIWILAFWAVLWGITLIILGVQLRKAGTATAPAA